MKFAASLNSRSARGGLLNIWRRIVVLEVGQSIAAAPLSTAVTKSDLGIFDDCFFYFFTKAYYIQFMAFSLLATATTNHKAVLTDLSFKYTRVGSNYLCSKKQKKFQNKPTIKVLSKGIVPTSNFLCVFHRAVSLWLSISNHGMERLFFP